MSEKILIFDTTLRDGEQSPGISLDENEKLEIAEQLARLGVDVIEAGFPVASQGDFEAVQAIAKTVQGPTICGLSRSSHKDIDRCWEAIEPATNRRIHTFIATSPTHMKHKLKMTPEQVKTEARSAVKRARSYTDDVEFSPEDASRSDFNFMCEVLQAAVDEGATTLNIPDTVGYGVPWDYGKKLEAIRSKVKGDYVLSTHCHNDLGLAVANSLSGIMAGARQIECAVNGIGERAGNAALEEIAMAIKTRNDHFAGMDVNIDTRELLRTSKLVSRLTGYPVQYNKAVVGRNAFAHEAGIHQHGVLEERTTYEIMDPNSVGQGESKIVLGKHSGRHAFADRLQQLGYELHGDALNMAFMRFKELADRKTQLSDADLEAIVADEIGGSAQPEFGLELLEYSGGSILSVTPKAKVVVSRNTSDSGTSETKAEIEVEMEGDGTIDAAFEAIKQATSIRGKLQDYSVNSVTEGADALADVSLRFESEDGVEVSGRGLSTDVVEASARAFLNAINKIETVRNLGDKTTRPGHIDSSLASA